MKVKYFEPIFSVTTTFTENEIAAGSARAYPGDESGNIYDEWTEEEDDHKTIDW